MNVRRTYLFSIFSARLRTPRPLGGRPLESEAVAARFRLFFEARKFRTQMPFSVQIQENLIFKRIVLNYSLKWAFSWKKSIYRSESYNYVGYGVTWSTWVYSLFLFDSGRSRPRTRFVKPANGQRATETWQSQSACCLRSLTPSSCWSSCLLFVD